MDKARLWLIQIGISVAGYCMHAQAHDSGGAHADSLRSNR